MDHPPPATSQIKINVDGSFLDSSSKGGIGGVFSDSKGKVPFQFSKKVYIDSVVHAELLAIREGDFGGGCIASSLISLYFV